MVALYAPNSPAWAAVFHGVLRANATLTSVNALYTAGELAAQLADSRARMVVTTAALLERAEAAAKEVGLDDDAVVVLDGARRPRLHRRPARLHRRATCTGGRARRPGRAALLLGHHRPAKGVILTHRNLVANLVQLHAITHVGPGTRFVAVLPFFHIYGMTCC